MKNEESTTANQAATVAGAGRAPRAGEKGRQRGAHEQEGRGHWAHEAGQGRDAGRDRGSHRLAAPHGEGPRQHPRQ
jgi:hypothetical protein